MTPVGVFFICQNEDKCHFVNSTILTHVLTHEQKKRGGNSGTESICG